MELAAPGQLVSVSFLGADARETALAPRARGLALNNGRLEGVAALRPDLIVTSGGPMRYAAELAPRMGVAVLALPPADTIGQVRANIAALGRAMGREAAARALIARFEADLGPERGAAVTALMIAGGGYAPRDDGLAAAYLARAGLRQMGGGGPVALERLLAAPPAVLVLNAYRADQTSRNAGWLAHPALARLPSRRIALDGRGWTCLGPQAARTLPGLRAAVAR